MRASHFVSGLGFEWNVGYVYDEMHRNAEDEEEDVR